MRSLLLPVLGVLAACAPESKGGKQQEKTTEPERKLAGVYPERFECKSIVTDEDLKALLGAVEINLLQSAAGRGSGLPAPCSYRVTMPQVMESWMFDFDCRDGMKQRADALFAQYTRTSAELVQQYNEAADAGIKPTDAGIEIRAPEDAVVVEVGTKALDHHGRGLLFVDDDAPCYIRVIGPDAPRRLALAKTVAKNLTFMNAPMTPRAAP